jgi:Fe-S-cluster-containing dehydrogenase component
MLDPFFAKWHGIDRTTIEWGPKIDATKCTGCGLCVVTCGEKRNVFGFDPNSKKAVVMYPQHCMVGCDNCAMACLWDAISFPHDDEYVKVLSRKINKEQITKELDKKLTENPGLVIE